VTAPHLLDLAALLGVVLLAMASPGPDMLLVARYALHGLAPALACIAGIVAGIAVHLAFALTGLAAVAAAAPAALEGLRWAGAAWLAWLGVGALRSGGGFRFATDGADDGDRGPAPFLAGALSNLLNVKVLLMMLALFTELLAPDAPVAVRLAGAGLVTVEVALVWTAFALAIRHPSVAPWLEARARGIDRLFGVVLLLIAVLVAAG
jgi:threonine/homoserine/homoserine lactone efflux protein